MTTSQYVLNLGLLAYILGANLGIRPVTRTRFLLPLVLVAAAGAVLLRPLPTLGNDVALEAIGVAAGAAFGAVAGLLVRVREDAGHITMTAGAWYAALWIAVIGGRVLFAYGAEHWYPRAIAEFSVQHQITGSEAWTSAFVLMALTMVLMRVAVTALRAGLVRRGNARLAVA